MVEGLAWCKGIGSGRNGAARSSVRRPWRLHAPRLLSDGEERKLLGSGGGTTRALWCFSKMAAECRGAAGEAGRVSTMEGRELAHDDHVGKSSSTRASE